MAWSAANVTASTSVLLREAQRSARRRTTWLARVGYTLLLLVIVFQMWWQGEVRVYDPSEVANLGRDLFKFFTATQWLMVSLAAPLIVGLGMIEEREDGTMELLALSRLTTSQIVLGKLMSRVITLGTLVLAGLPVLALIATFGGVGVWEALGVALGTLTIVVSLGAVGAWAGLHFDNGIVGIGLATFWGVVVLMVVPILSGGILEDLGGNPSWVSPYGMMNAEGPGALLHVFLIAPSVLFIGRISMPVFRMTVGARSGSDEELLSPEIFRLQRLERLGSVLPVLWLVAPFAFAMSVWFLTGLFGNRFLRGDAGELVGAFLVLAYVMLTQLAFTAFFVWQTHAFVRWRRVQEERRALAVEAAEVAREIGYATKAVYRRGLSTEGHISGNPVAWRERWTGAHGVTRGLSKLGLALGVGLVLLVVAVDGELDEEVAMLFGGMGVFAGTVLSGVAATSSFVQDRRQGTLPLLLQTTMSPTRIVIGKLQAVFGLVSFLLVPGWLLGAWGAMAEMGSAGASLHSYSAMTCGDFLFFRGLTWVKVGWITTWALGHWVLLVLCCLVVAARVRPTRLAWGTNIGLGMVWVVLPVYVADGLDLDELARFWWPFANNELWRPSCGLAPTSLGAVVLVWGLAAVVLGWLVLRLRDWGLK